MDQRDPGRVDAPLFSIITAVFNGAGGIEATILSLARQSCRDFEYLVIDAASTDGTVALLERHDDDIDWWCSQRDDGIYDAWNRGLRRARGRWIAFLGAGDEYLPDALEKYAQYLLDGQGAGLQYVSSRVEITRRGGVYATIGKAWRWPDFSHHMTVAHVGSMHSRQLFEQYGTFDSRYRICGDYEFLLRARGALRAGFLPALTARMPHGGVSLSRPRVALLETMQAKLTSGRPAWRCSLEFRYALAKSVVGSMVRS
jgi:glycosyltransferase involved in cell wall biosynthesis